MRRLLALMLFVSSTTAAAQTVSTSQIVLRCASASRLSGASEAIIYRDCDDGQQYISSGGGAFAVLGSGGGGGSGTVTSVGFSAPAAFSVTGSPITTSGTITLGLQTQNANLIWAGPTSGAAAAPTFRAAVKGDLPTTVAYTDVGQTFTGTNTFFNLTVTGTCTGCGTAPANMATTDTTQTISGAKTFTSLVTVDESDGLSVVHVESTTAGDRAVVELFEDGNNRGAFYADFSDDVTLLEAGSGHALGFNVNGGVTRALNMDTSGNFDFSGYSKADFPIQKTLPKLVLNSTGDDAAVSFRNSGTEGGALYFDGINNLLKMQGQSGHGLAFDVDASTRAITIDTDGDVGVGVTPATSKLQVAGTVDASTGYFERSRSVRMGEWTTVAYNAANFTATTGTWTVDSGDQFGYSYRIIGKSMLVSYGVTTSDVSATPGGLRVAIPGGFTAAAVVIDTALVGNNGAALSVGTAETSLGGSNITISLPTGNWSTTSADNTRLFGSIEFPIN